jgi:uncharacterized membrane protein YecN with MAPEG domain
MSTVSIVPVYASALALLFVALSVRTLRLRRSLGIPIGDGGNPGLLRAMRVHANFTEYAPLGLLLVFFVEIRGADPWLVHGLGSALVLGRLAHALGVSQPRERLQYRVLGMALTLTVILTAAFTLLLTAA